MKSLNLTLLCILAIVAICSIDFGCGTANASESYQYNTIDKPLPDPVYMIRVKILEQNVVCLINVTIEQYDNLRVGDRVWVDPTKHAIDDVSQTAMKAVMIY